jgi:hypothetical protein
MEKKKFLLWLPRVLSIVFILFISMFALDVFGEYGFPEVMVALFMHLIPSFLIGIATWIAWKRQRIGGILFIMLGVVFTLFFWNGVWTFMISGPLFVIGALFTLTASNAKPR